MIRNAIRDLKKYKEYLLYSVKSELKVKLMGTYLGYLWWIIDPLMYMLVYVLVVGVIFDRGGPDYPIFVFCALLPWKWTSNTISQCTTSIKSKSDVLQQVYLPKFILPLIRAMVNSVHYIFGLTMLFILMPFFNIGFSIHFFEFVFVFFVNLSFILGASLIISHLGVYFADLKNILAFTIRFWFYLSPGLYELERIPLPYRNLWYLNPMTVFYQSYRNIFMYNSSPNYLGLLLWFSVSIILIVLGLKFLYRDDRKYTKVI